MDQAEFDYYLPSIENLDSNFVVDFLQWREGLVDNRPHELSNPINPSQWKKSFLHKWRLKAPT